VLVHDPFKQLPIGDVAYVKRESSCKLAASGPKVVKDDGLDARIATGLRNRATDPTGATRDQNLHNRTPTGAVRSQAVGRRQRGPRFRSPRLPETGVTSEVKDSTGRRAEHEVSLSVLNPSYGAQVRFGTAAGETGNAVSDTAVGLMSVKLVPRVSTTPAVVAGCSVAPGT
jgi:hypothetical protein